MGTDDNTAAQRLTIRLPWRWCAYTPCRAFIEVPEDYIDSARYRGPHIYCDQHCDDNDPRWPSNGVLSAWLDDRPEGMSRDRAQRLLDRAHQAFTLTEMLVTFVVLGLLAALAFATFQAIEHRARIEVLDDSALGAVRYAAALDAEARTGHVPGHLDAAAADTIGAVAVTGYPTTGKVQAAAWDLCREVTVAADGSTSEPTDCTAPGALVLTGTVVEPSGEVTVTWDPDPEAATYEVCQGDACTTTSEPSATLPVSSEPVTVTAFAADGYRVASTGSGATTTTADGASNAPPAPDETEPVSVQATDNAVALSWNGLGSAVERYDVQRCADGTAGCTPSTIVGTADEDGSATYDLTDNLGSYVGPVCYRVLAVSGTYSTASNTVCVQVTSPDLTLVWTSTSQQADHWLVMHEVWADTQQPYDAYDVEACNEAGECVRGPASASGAVVPGTDPGHTTLRLFYRGDDTVLDTAFVDGSAFLAW